VSLFFFFPPRTSVSSPRRLAVFPAYFFFLFQAFFFSPRLSFFFIACLCFPGCWTFGSWTFPCSFFSWLSPSCLPLCSVFFCVLKWCGLFIFFSPFLLYLRPTFPTHLLSPGLYVLLALNDPGGFFFLPLALCVITVPSATAFPPPPPLPKLFPLKHQLFLVTGRLDFVSSFPFCPSISFFFL